MIAVAERPAIDLSLYDLSDERVALDALSLMDDGEVTPEFEAMEADIAARMVLKADAFGGYIEHLEEIVDACKARETRSAKRRKAAEGRIERLKRYGLMALQHMDRPRVDGTLFTLAVQNNPASVQVDVLPGALPLAFVRVIPEQYQPDKVAIGKALKAGETIAGCSLVQTQSLRIK